MRRRLVAIGIQAKIVVLAASIVLTVLVLVSVVVVYLESDSLEVQTGTRALDIARTFAANPVVQNAFYGEDPIAEIAPMADQVRRSTGAQFVIVMDRAGRLFSHPVSGQLGKATASLDYGPALIEGRSSYTKLEEGRSTALAGMTPVHGRDGELVGLVSVGFRVEDVNLLAVRFGRRVAGTAAVGLTVGIAGALLLARQLKRQMLGLEPPQLAARLEERIAVIEAVREGILAIDDQERITVMNQEAMRILGLEGDPVGQQIRDVVPQSRLPEILQTGEAHYAQEMILGGSVVVTNRVPIRFGSKIVGVVASFRDRTELIRLDTELTAVRRYSEALRAQAHEFNNRLHAVAGLVQLGATDEALEYILRTEGQHQHLLDLLARAVPDPLVGAIILGKYNRAAELHVRLDLDPASRFTRAPGDLGADLLVTVLGNLTDNAVEAVQPLPEARRWVRLHLDDEGSEIRITVADGGHGVPDHLRDQIFEQGYSTKVGGHCGFGLALVHLLVGQAGGRIEIANQPSRFIVTFPGRVRT
ncbi:MAG TPA: sensor histidine kinase [Symbiobacteriaceae bacterium]|nr:sensor histidine kinase [Symbiobacteriaceae bacterium]